MSKKEKFQNYVDPTGEYSNKQLKLSEWYLHHKLLLQNIGKWVLIVWCFITVVFSLYAWGDYLIFGLAEDKKMAVAQTRQVQNFDQIRFLYSAKEPVVNNVRVYRSGNDQYDFIADVENTNDRWHATITYHFSFGSEATKSKTVVLLPGVGIPIGVFGHNVGVFPRDVRFVIDQVKWRKINPHSIKEVNKFIDQRINFTFNNFSFIRPGSSFESDVPRIKFDLTNNSAYNYWSPVFHVELLNGRQTVGVMFLSVENFKAGETQPIDIRYFGGDISVTGIEINSVLDVFDNSVYMNPGA